MAHMPTFGHFYFIPQLKGISAIVSCSLQEWYAYMIHSMHRNHFPAVTNMTAGVKSKVDPILPPCLSLIFKIPCFSLVVLFTFRCFHLYNGSFLFLQIPRLLWDEAMLWCKQVMAKPSHKMSGVGFQMNPVSQSCAKHIGQQRERESGHFWRGRPTRGWRLELSKRKSYFLLCSACKIAVEQRQLVCGYLRILHT